MRRAAAAGARHLLSTRSHAPAAGGHPARAHRLPAAAGHDHRLQRGWVGLLVGQAPGSFLACLWPPKLGGCIRPPPRRCLRFHAGGKPAIVRVEGPHDRGGMQQVGARATRPVTADPASATRRCSASATAAHLRQPWAWPAHIRPCTQPPTHAPTHTPTRAHAPTRTHPPTVPPLPCPALLRRWTWAPPASWCPPCSPPPTWSARSPPASTPATATPPAPAPSPGPSGAAGGQFPASEEQGG